MKLLALVFALIFAPLSMALIATSETLAPVVAGR